MGGGRRIVNLAERPLEEHDERPHPPEADLLWNESWNTVGTAGFRGFSAGNCEGMGGIRCVDGSYLTVTPVACTDSVGTPYEITLELSRNGTPYGSVGERCGWLLARLARGVDEARQGRGEARRWSDPDDRFPGEEPESELFSFRYRTRAGLPGGGELRCQLRTIPVWQPGRGAWRLTRRAYVEAWGAMGVGMRAVLTSAELSRFVRQLVNEAEGCLEGRDLA